MEISQFNQNFRRNINISALIITVNSLAAMQDFAHLRLSQIFIFTQVSNSLVNHTQNPLINKINKVIVCSSKSAIDF